MTSCQVLGCDAVAFYGLDFDDSVDVYDVEIHVADGRLLPVEEILVAVDEHAHSRPIYQEDLTVELAVTLNATVSTVGVHSGVETRCEAEPA